MNILTDILSLFKRKQLVEELTPDDLIVVGRHEPPKILGIASPIPYKSVKLVKAKDLTVTTAPCTHVNLDNGSSGNTPAYIFKNITSDPCAVNFRSIKAIGNNISVVENNNEIEVSTEGEPNDGVNVGNGAAVYKDKVGETLRFKTIKSKNGSINIDPLSDEINIELNITNLNNTVFNKISLIAPGGGVWDITVDDSGNLITSPIS